MIASTTSEQRMWDEEGLLRDPISCQCWIRLFTTINSQHYDWKKCDDQIRMHGRRFCSCLKDVTGVANEKRCLRSSWRLLTDLSQSNSMLQNSIQASINDKHNFWATNVRWGGYDPVSCQCRIRLFTTIDSQTMIEQKCDDQIRKKILLCTR
jgi:hypothetical protein